MKIDLPAPHGRHHLEANTPNSEGPERIDPRWAWHHRTLLRLRDRLLHAPGEAGPPAATPPDMRGLAVDEALRDDREQGVLWAELGREDDKLFEVDAALNRLRKGTYGFCELTGAPIPEERLRAVPWARYAAVGAKAAAKHPRMVPGL